MTIVTIDASIFKAFVRAAITATSHGAVIICWTILTVIKKATPITIHNSGVSLSCGILRLKKMNELICAFMATLRLQLQMTWIRSFRSYVTHIRFAFGSVSSSSRIESDIFESESGHLNVVLNWIVFYFLNATAVWTARSHLKGNSGIFKPGPYFWHEIRSSTHREQFGESWRPSEDI